MTPKVNKLRHLTKMGVANCRGTNSNMCRFYSTLRNLNHLNIRDFKTMHMRKFLINDNILSSFQSNTRRWIHKIPGASTRDMADLEERLWSAVGSTVKDPEINVDLKSLGWMNRRLAVSDDGTVQILLQLPTLLHPALDDLKNLVKFAAEREIGKWISEKGLDSNIEAKVNVEAVASKPVPWMTKDPEDQKDVDASLGPGLANVAHCIAVYSCKVSSTCRHIHCQYLGVVDIVN